MPNPFLSSSLAALATFASLLAQDLRPEERQAFAEARSGQAAKATATLLALAEAEATAPGVDATRSARVEAWATAAAHHASELGDPAWLARFDALRKSPLAASDALLADRLGVIAWSVAGARVDAEGTRATELGVIRECWLIGPFANERGAGYRKSLPPEQGLDLDATLPGKRRDVRWRRLPALGPRSRWPLHRLLVPHEQSLAYAAVALTTERARVVALELGSTGSVRVFCNGTEVFARDVERPFAFDQDAVALPLQTGHNLLLLKLCHQEGAEFTFTARVRELDGSRTDVQATTDPAALRTAAARAPATDAATATVPLGGRSTFAIGSAQGADALRLAWLWRARSTDGDRDRRDARAAEAATQALPDVAETWLVLASTQRRDSRSAADRDENDRRRSLERALRCEPGHVAAQVELGHLLRGSSRLWRSAAGLADAALTSSPDHAGAHLLRMACLRDAGLESLANAEAQRHARRDGAPLALLDAAADAFQSLPERALPLHTRLFEALGGEERATDLAHALARTGGAAAARELLQDWIARDPYGRNARWHLAELQLAANDPRGALTTLEAWLAVSPDDAAFLGQASRCWRRLRDAEPTAAATQLERLQAALAVEPTRRDDERYVGFLRSDAGEASAEANAYYAKERVDAAALVAADQGPPADAKTANDALHWLLRQQVVRANGNGTTSSYTHQIVRVLTNDGTRSLAFYQLPFWSSEQRGRLLACTVFKADGSVQRPPLQGARVRLPDLRPGDVVAVEGRVDDLGPSFFGDYFGLVHGFTAPDGSPVRASELVVLAEPGRDYQVQQAHGAPAAERSTLADGTLRFAFRMRDLPRDVPELRRPRRSEYEPVVRITTYRDWDHFATWWWNLIKPQLEVTEAMKATVARLCEGRPSTAAKIAAIYHFVTTEVRYEAWEFGVHGYKPYSTAVIHDRRHGDCKDKALLLCALLGEIGVPCHPVLIFADPLRSQDDLTLAMVQQFNHCIAWLPPHDGMPGRFLDGTAIWHPTDTLPDMDQGAAVLVVAEGRADLRTVPFTTPEQNRSAAEYVVALHQDGTAELEQHERPLGNAAVALREMLASEPARRREVVERRLLRSFGKAALRDVVADAGTDPEAAVSLHATASLPEVGQRDGRRWQLPSSHPEQELLALATETERHRPLLLGPPRGEHQTMRYRVPPGWRPSELPAGVQQEAPFATFTMQWRREGDSVVVERHLQLLRDRIQPDQHAAFREFATAVRTADSQLVLLQQEGDR